MVPISLKLLSINFCLLWGFFFTKFFVNLVFAFSGICYCHGYPRFGCKRRVRLWHYVMEHICLEVCLLFVENVLGQIWILITTVFFPTDFDLHIFIFCLVKVYIASLQFTCFFKFCISWKWFNQKLDQIWYNRAYVSSGYI